MSAPRPLEIMNGIFDALMLEAVEAYAGAGVTEWRLDIAFGPGHDPDTIGRPWRPRWRVIVWYDGEARGYGEDPVSLRGALEAALAAAGLP